MTREVKRGILFFDRSLLPATVLLLTAILLFCRLGTRPLWGPEGRWAEVAREMQLSGNYFRPTINGSVYFGKPLLSYWLIVAASELDGQLNETTARLPSAILGFLGVALIMLLARRLYDFRTAVVAGIILATSYSYIFFSRLAAADIAAVTGVLATLTLFVRNETQQSGWWILGLWTIMAVTSLTKGLTGFALPLVVIGTYSLIAGGWREMVLQLRGPSVTRARWFLDRFHWLINTKTPGAVIVAALIYLSPFLISALTMHSSVGIARVWHENVVRYVAPFDHRGPVYLYLGSIFALMAPWSAFLPAALLQISRDPKERSDRFSLTYFCVVFLFFTAAGSRRNYYLLPILPAVALLLARSFIAARDKLDGRATFLMKAGFIFLAVFAISGGLVAFLPVSLRPGALSRLPAVPEPTVLGLVWAGILIAIAYAASSLRAERIVVSVFGMAYLSFLYVFVFALPGVRQFSTGKAFAQTVRKELGGDYRRLVFYKLGDPALYFYLLPPGQSTSIKTRAVCARLLTATLHSG